MEPSLIRAKLLIAIDDTDIPGQGGTGRVARRIAHHLADRFAVWGVTRHQLAILPQINYTQRNSTNVIHLLTCPRELEPLAEKLVIWLWRMSLAGAEPGLCLARPYTLLDTDLGRAAKYRMVNKEEVRSAAKAADAFLCSPCTGEAGIIGAFAGACLAASGADGRFVQIGNMRSLSGSLSIKDILTAGGDEVRSIEEDIINEGCILAERLRPALRDGKCVLYCRLGTDGVWVPIIGAPGDKEKEEGPNAST